jgi:zinc and cadmium transporter
MSVLGNILFFTFLATILSLLLVSILLLHKTFIQKISFLLVSLAAGSLLATGFLDTMKEAVAMAGDQVFLWVTVSIAAFFAIERVFLFLHHHHEPESKGGEHLHDNKKLRLPVSFLLFGDGMHNFIDGASIAASFMADYKLGVITSIAVFIHEIPHELGDFGVLLQAGKGRKDVLLFNLATGVTAFAGALLAYFLGTAFQSMIPMLLAFTTANFIYLSTIDLLPEIHHQNEGKAAVWPTIIFFCGIALIAVLMALIPA